MKKKCLLIALVIVVPVIIICSIVYSLSDPGADIGRAASAHGYLAAADTTEDITAIYQDLSVDNVHGGTQPDYISRPKRAPVPLQSYSADAAGFVTRCYHILMCRNPDDGGLNYWQEALTSGEQSARDLICSLMSSDEFISMRRPPEEIVYELNVLMNEGAPDDGDMQADIDCLNACMSDGYIVDSIAKKTGFDKTCEFYRIPQGSFEVTEERDHNYVRTSFVSRIYKNCLKRSPDAGGLNYWCVELENGATASFIVQSFLFSREYNEYHEDNSEFATTLYHIMLGREPDAEGYESWVNELDHACTREHAFNSFLQSDEFGSICTDAGIDRGWPIEEPDGTREWQDNIRFLELVNEERRTAGLSELATREDLWRDAAMVRASELVFPFSHQRPDGRSCFTALSDVKMYHYDHAAELIAQGRRLTPEKTMSLWASSPEHAAVIKDPDVMYVATGSLHPQVGSKTYYCQYYLRK